MRGTFLCQNLTFLPRSGALVKKKKKNRIHNVEQNQYISRFFSNKYFTIENFSHVKFNIILKVSSSTSDILYINEQQSIKTKRV